MKQDFTSVQNIYIICGKTDMRKGIDGLAALIKDSFKLDPYSDSIFLFSGTSKNREKPVHTTNHIWTNRIFSRIIID
ncbi:IS66 family insertion sequence element accessory protein TnpB [Lysinibacillus sp. NPDC097214]|uniref:IS66 family insertion sequence element accessory protein TnpB n=1 Tax=Lysinibacillus sp. NPDC097214 TaxID=3390584 RepID=UPI003CFD9E1D